eukprot:jgi/Mesvir1/16805/Mv15170-RA.2
MGQLEPAEWQFAEFRTGNCSYVHVELWDMERINERTRASSMITADAMLLLKRGIKPCAVYNNLINGWSWDKDTIVDFTSFRLLQPYHRISLDMNDREHDEQDDGWYVGVVNVDQWMQHSLQYKLAVTCHQEPPCPRSCNGHGTCKNGACTCERGWGDVGCDKTILPLSSDWQHTSLVKGNWAYYEVEVSQPGSSLLVELKRTRGDPVLFVKEVNGGYVAGGVPSELDFSSFADKEAFHSRLNYHHRILHGLQPGRYYVAVFNNFEFINETSQYDIRAVVRLGTSEPLCPMDCNKDGVDGAQGFCTRGSDFGSLRCMCSSGYAGAWCQGRIEPINIRDRKRGVLAQGSWQYYKLSAVTIMQMRDTTVLFNSRGGYAMLAVLKNEVPTLLNNDDLYPPQRVHASQDAIKFQLPTDLSEPDVFFGIYNMDYYEHSVVEFTLELTSLSSDGALNINPFMNIIFGIVSSMLLCLLMTVCKKMVQHRNMRAREAAAAAPELANEAGANGISGGVPAGWSEDGRRGVVRRGLDPAVINRFRVVTFKSGGMNKEDASCPVCLGDYEDDDVLRQLPRCDHLFHQACIDLWLGNNITCPLCRLPVEVAGGDAAPNPPTAMGAPVPAAGGAAADVNAPGGALPAAGALAGFGAVVPLLLSQPGPGSLRNVLVDAAPEPAEEGTEMTDANIPGTPHRDPGGEATPLEVVHPRPSVVPPVVVTGNDGADTMSPITFPSSGRPRWGGVAGEEEDDLVRQSPQMRSHSASPSSSAEGGPILELVTVH